LLPQFLVQWNANQLSDITPEHFAIATLHYPAIRHIVVGCGYTVPCPTPYEWITYLNKHRITVELVTLVSACRLFNMQNTLFQNFACALVYDPKTTNRLHSIARKVDLGMKDPYASQNDLM